jgi:hypothetical protein
VPCRVCCGNSPTKPRCSASTSHSLSFYSHIPARPSPRSFALPHATMAALAMMSSRALVRSTSAAPRPQARRSLVVRASTEPKPTENAGTYMFKGKQYTEAEVRPTPHQTACNRLCPAPVAAGWWMCGVSGVICCHCFW